MFQQQQQQQSLFVILPFSCDILQKNIKSKVKVLAAWNNHPIAFPHRPSFPFFLFKSFLRRYVDTYIKIVFRRFVVVASSSSVRFRRFVFVVVVTSSSSWMSSSSSSLGCCTVDCKFFSIAYCVALTLQPAKDLSNILTLMDC